MAAAVVVLALVSGCGGNDGADAPASPKSVDAIKQDSKLIRPGSPGRAVITFWKFVQVGAVPPAVLAYAPEVRRDVGAPSIAGALASQQGNLADTKPVVWQVRQTRAGPMVLVRAVRSEGSSPDYAFLLRRRQGRYEVTYDSLTASALRSYVTQRRTDATGTSQRQAARAREQGELIAQQYRLAGLNEASGNGR